MGKKRQRRANKCLLEADAISNEDIPSEEEPKNGKRYQDSYLIDPQTYDSLANEMLRKPPPDRNVFISMKDYDLKDITPNYKYSVEAPTNLVVFCMRLIRHNHFQPILVLQRYDSEDQSYVIAHCLKAIIKDLASLSLYVMATISPPTNLFRKVMDHLVDIPDLSKHTNYISYHSEPFRDILHFYDIDTIISSFQDLLFSAREVCFIADSQLKCSKWEDVQYVLELNRIDCHYTRNNGKPYNIFNERFQLDMGRALNKGRQKINRATDILVNTVFPFSNIREIERNNIEVLTSLYTSLDDLKLALTTMHFRQIEKTKNENKETEADSRDTSKPFSTMASTTIEIAKAEMDSIMETIDKSIEKDKKLESVNVNKKSLAHVVNDHLSTNQKSILKNEYNVDLMDTQEIPKSFAQSMDNLSISSGDFDFQVNDMSQFFGAIVNFNDNNNTVNFGTNKNNQSEHRKKSKPKKKTTNNTGISDLNCNIGNEKMNKKENVFINKVVKSDRLDSLIDTNNDKNDHYNKKVNGHVESLAKNDNFDSVVDKINMEENSIDAQDYINFLKQSCDTKKTGETLDFETKTKIYAELFDVVKDCYAPNRLTNDWLSTIEGLPKLKDKLIYRRVKEFLPMALTLVHSDYFVNVVKQRKNGGLKTRLKAPEDMAVLDYNAALSMLTNSLYLIQKN